MRLVPLSEIFNVEYGVNLDLNKLNKTSRFLGLPFVSRTANNNGVSAYVEEIKGILPNEAHTLSISGGGSVLETFYQEAPYYSGRDLYVLKPISELSKISMLAYAVYIKANKYRYNYGRQANKTLRDIKVPHPNEVEKLLERTTLPKGPSNKPHHEKAPLLQDQEWESFRYDQLFFIERGRGPRKKDISLGKVPFVTSTDSNNGVTDFISENPSHQGNVIGVNRNGSVGLAFYQSEAFCSTEDVHIFIPKFKMNAYTAMYLCTLIKKESYRFSYGRKWGIERMKESFIKLPVNSEGIPDWQFMEDYIKSLPYSSNL